MALAFSSTPQKLLILLPWQPPAIFLLRLEERHPLLQVVSHYHKGHGSDQLPDELSADFWRDVTVLLAWRALPTPELAPNLRYVQLLSAGCNHISTHPLFTDTETAFCTANGVHPPQIAEWVIATFLSHQHHLLEYYEYQKEGRWEASKDDEDVEDAVGLRMGILGYGAIGRQVACVAKAIGMEVLAYTLRERNTPESMRDDTYRENGLGDPGGAIPSRWFSGATQEAINNFVSQDLDILVIAMPLTKLTKNMIAAPQFKLMSKKKTFISNIGRGQIVNTDDLMAALDASEIRGAALDVTDPEPLSKDHPLWKKKNVFITPHTSGNSSHYNERVLAILELNLQRLRDDEPLINRVDRELGY